MSPKAKITLIIWAIIAFLGGWVVFVLSLIQDNSSQQTNILAKTASTNKVQTKINQNQTKSSNTTSQSTPQKTPTIPQNSATNTTWTTTQNQTTSSNNQTSNSPKSTYPNTKWNTFTILAPYNLESKLAWRFFQINFKKHSGWIIKFKFYKNGKDYDKDLTYKLATKDQNFDFAIVPAYWFNHLNNITDISFQVKWSINLASIFDYNFENFVKNNSIKAIPFAIEPIIGFWLADKVKNPIQDFDSRKQIIINSPTRLASNWKIKTMPIFLGYDNNYLKYIQNNTYSLFPVFDFILHYYFFKKSQQWAKLIKDFWFSMIYKTFDFGLFQRYAIKYKKYDFCKNYEKFCLLFDKKTDLVYWLSSDLDYLKQNRLSIFKKFRFKTTKIQLTSVPLANSLAEYPAKWRIIIINPHSKNIKNLWKFIKAYILLGQNNLLPFYKNLISPFMKNQVLPTQLKFLQPYLGRFLILYNMNLNYPQTLSKKEINYLKWNIDF